MEQIRHSQVNMSLFESIVSGAYSSVSDCSELPLSASMTKQPPRLKSPSQVMGTAMDGEFSAVGGWKEGCFVSNREWEGKKRTWVSRIQIHNWFYSWVALGKYCLKTAFGNIHLDVCVFYLCLWLVPEFSWFARSGGDCFKVAWGSVHGNEMLCSYKIFSLSFSRLLFQWVLLSSPWGAHTGSQLLTCWWTAKKCSTCCKWELGRWIYSLFTKREWGKKRLNQITNQRKFLSACPINRRGKIHCIISSLQMILPALFLWFHCKWLFGDVCFLELEMQIEKGDYCGHVLFLKKVRSSICIYLVSSGWIFTKSLWVSWEICTFLEKCAELRASHNTLPAFCTWKAFFPIYEELTEK